MENSDLKMLEAQLKRMKIAYTINIHSIEIGGKKSIIRKEILIILIAFCLLGVLGYLIVPYLFELSLWKITIALGLVLLFLIIGQREL